jgi:hypothetical protein
VLPIMTSFGLSKFVPLIPLTKRSGEFLYTQPPTFVDLQGAACFSPLKFQNIIRILSSTEIKKDWVGTCFFIINLYTRTEGGINNESDLFSRDSRSGIRPI